MGSDKQARNGGSQSRNALADGQSALVAARRAAGDDDSWSERDSEAEGMNTDEVSEAFALTTSNAHAAIIVLTGSPRSREISTKVGVDKRLEKRV